MNNEQTLLRSNHPSDGRPRRCLDSEARLQHWLLSCKWPLSHTVAMDDCYGMTWLPHRFNGKDDLFGCSTFQRG